MHLWSMIGVRPDMVVQGRTAKSLICKYESVKYMTPFPLRFCGKSVEHL
jgi:hypothetical protein